MKNKKQKEKLSPEPKRLEDPGINEESLIRWLEDSEQIEEE
jgi:hypothetical protein